MGERGRGRKGERGKGGEEVKCDFKVCGSV